MRPKQLYVVINGRKIGIFNAWAGDNGAQEQIKGYSGAVFRGKFYDLDDAKAYFKKHALGEPIIHFDCSVPTKSLSEPDGKEYTTYVLIDPRNKHPFYVGQTSDFEKRKMVHLNIKSNPFRKVDKYIAELQSEGLEPEFYMAEVCVNLEMSLESELKWVRYCLKKGYTLCNRWKEHRELII